MKPKTNPINAEEVKDLALITTPSSLEKPQHDAEFAHVAAKRLKDIVRQNNWISNIKGKEHLAFEAWQTVGKFYGYLVDTDYKEPEYVEYGGVWGFKAHAQVVNEHTGLRVGGASALCMSDEMNWRGKDKFSLMAMAQTRAGGRALRQTLAWVVALAGYNPTPSEEMIDINGNSKSSHVSSNHKQDAAPVENDTEVNNVESDKSDKFEILNRTCSVCGTSLTEPVYLYSINHFKKKLCMPHQQEERRAREV